MLETLLITDEEKEKRDSEVSDDEDSNYFNSLNVLLQNNCNVLQNLHLIAARESDYRGLKNTIGNTIKKILKKDLIITKAKVEQIYDLYSTLKSKKYSFNEKVNNDINLSIDVDSIYELIFKNYNSSIDEIGNKIFELEDIEANIEIHDSIKEIKEKLDREYGLSINDFEKLKECIARLKKINIL